MSIAALKPLFHPFESGALAPPASGARILFIGAKPGLRLPEGFDSDLSLVQGFRPDFLALQREGFTVVPQPEGRDYDLVFIIAGRHRGQNESWIAEAVERVVPGALIVVAGSTDDGIASLRKRVERQIDLDGSLPKYHGVVFWFRRPADAAAMVARLHAELSLIDGRFETAPGMFSHDRIDSGSKLLAEALPDDLFGKVADFCAGWGYLSAELVLRCPKVSSIDLYEADHPSLEAARRNLRNPGTVAPQFFWRDLLAEPVEDRYDAIVMNPPFHQGRAAEPEIGQRLIAVAAKALRSRGRLFLVANKGLPYEKALAGFPEHRQIAGDGAFKVFAARR